MAIRILRFVALFAIALWLGTMFSTTFFVAPSLFANESGETPTRSVAGNVVGPILHRMDKLGWIAPAVAAAALCGAIALGARGRAVKVGVALLAVAWAAGLYSGISVSGEIRDLRGKMKSEFGSYDATPADHELRKRFGALHGVSMIVVLANMLLATGALACAAEAGGAAARRDG